MKLGISICTFLLGSLAFGQSAKKTDPDLTAQLSAARKDYDSLNLVFLQTQKQLQSDLSAINVMYAFEMEKQVSEYYELHGATMERYHKLTRLGQQPKIHIDSIRPLDVSRHRITYMETVGYTDGMLKWTKVMDTLRPEKMKKKVLKTAIPQQLEKYALAREVNLKRIEQLRTYFTKVDPYKHALSSAKDENELVLRKMDAMYKVLDAQVEEIRLAYERDKKDLKGVSSAYRDEFEGTETVQGSMEYAEFAYEMEEPKVEKEEEAPVILEVVEEQASFPGGMEAMRTYLQQNIVVPTAVKEGKITGKCYLKFVISQSGNVSNVRILKGVTDCPECDSEAFRVVKAMPDWIPGKNNGKVVNQWYTLPIKFGN